MKSYLAMITLKMSGYKEVLSYDPGASFDTFISARLVVVALSRFSALQQCVRTKRAKKDQTSNYLPFNG